MNTQDKSNPVPRLGSLDEPASWLNRAGRVDRSACFVVAAAQLWRRLDANDWTTRTPARTSSLPERVGAIELTAHDLAVLHKGEPPRPLTGDYRTPKSNAMRLKRPQAADGVRGLAKPKQAHSNQKTADTVCGFDPADNARDLLDPPDVNPNRGAGFANRWKILGLDAMASVTLTIERYRLHARLSQHFLVCPVCASAGGAGVPPVNGRGGRSTSTRKPRAKLPAGRVTKLYLPLCTEREWEDAQLAHLWLRTHVRPNRPLPPEAAVLIERYRELFPPRALRCRACLGLRYGEVKRSKRQKNNKTADNVRGFEAADAVGGLAAPSSNNPAPITPATAEKLLLELSRLMSVTKAKEILRANDSETDV